MKFSEKKSRMEIARRDFTGMCLKGAFLPSFLSGLSRPLLEPLFRKESAATPIVETPNQMWNEGFSAAFKELQGNLQSKTAFIYSRWARPAPRFFSTFLWETSFISLVWGLWMPDIGLEILEPFIERQRIDGRIPDEVSPVRSTALTQPPLIAFTIEQINRAKFYPDFIKSVYPVLTRYYRWLRAERFRNGFYYWENANESAMGNSPRFFAGADETRPLDMKRLIPVDINAEMVLFLQSMAALAKTLGKQGDATSFLRDAEIQTARINNSMWNAQDGMYYDIYDGKHLRTQTISSFFPMIAGIPSGDQCAALIKNITDPARFWTPTPFPSVSKSDPKFKLDGWRGPVWLSASYLVARGLENCGRRDVAAEASWRIINHVYKTWNKRGHFYETYHPVTGDIEGIVSRKENIVNSYLMGEGPAKDFVGSTGLVNNLLVEDIIGIRWKDAKPVFEPALPPEWVGKTVRYKSPYLKLDCVIKLEEPTKARVKVTAPSNYELTVPNTAPWRK